MGLESGRCLVLVRFSVCVGLVFVCQEVVPVAMENPTEICQRLIEMRLMPPGCASTGHPCRPRRELGTLWKTRESLCRGESWEFLWE